MITVLPMSDTVHLRRKDVKVELIIMGTVLGLDLLVAGVPLPANPEDKARIQKHCWEVLPRILDGWKAGVGSPLFKTQRLREIPGGIGGVEKGMRIMQEGAYGREKLVCKIA